MIETIIVMFYPIQKSTRTEAYLLTETIISARGAKEVIDPNAVSPSELVFVSGKEKQIVNIQRSIGVNIVVLHSVNRQRRVVATRLRGQQGRGPYAFNIRTRSFFQS